MLCVHGFDYDSFCSGGKPIIPRHGFHTSSLCTYPIAIPVAEGPQTDDLTGNGKCYGVTNPPYHTLG